MFCVSVVPRRTQDIAVQANTNHLYNMCTMLDQRRRRWADVVEMLYKCFVFAGIIISIWFLFLIEILYSNFVFK